MHASGSVAVVTGAGSGIGRATARALVHRGHHVVAVGRRPAPLEALVDELGAEQVLARPLDVAQPDAVVDLVSGVVERFGRLDVLVNNAGTAVQLAVAETTPQQFREILDVNLVGPAAAIHAAWPTFIRQGRGYIVNVSSLAQLDPFPGFFAYASSKAGLHLLTVVAANEGAESGIRAFTVAPGVVDTPLHRRLMPDGVPAEMRLEADDVAGLIADLVDGRHDELSGWVLAAVAPGITESLQAWIDGHPGGGVRIVELGGGR